VLEQIARAENGLDLPLGSYLKDPAEGPAQAVSPSACVLAGRPLKRGVQMEVSEQGDSHAIPRKARS
jgi:hypothetical protein